MHGAAASPSFALDRWSLGRVALAVSIANIFAVALGYASYMTSADVAALWPPTGLLLTALLRSSPPRWLLLLGAGVAGQLAFEQALGLQAPSVSLAYCAVNGVEALASAALLRRFFGPDEGGHELRSLSALVVVGAGVGPMLGATLGALVVAWQAPSALYWDMWGVWRSADSLGVLVTAPFLISLSGRPSVSPAAHAKMGRVERYAWALAFVLAIEVAVGPFELPVPSVVDFPYLLFLPLVWAAVRFPPPVAGGAVFVTALATVLHGAADQGPFMARVAEPLRKVLDLQSFLTALALTTFAAAAIAAGRRRAEQERAQTLHNVAQLERREALRRLSGGVSHDLNNLLSIVAGNAQLLGLELQSAALNRGEAEECVAQIRQATIRGKALLGQLLVFRDRHVSRPEDTSLNGVIEGLRPMLRHLLGTDYEVRYELSREAPTAHVDPARLQTALIALLTNAREAMPHGGVLTLASGVAEGEAWLAVTDTGRGIAESDLPRVREAFFSTKEGGKGTGLGLTSACAIVEADAGQVQIDSALGRGTSVRCSFRSVHAHRPRAASDPAPGTTRVDARSVLLCEDDDMVRLVVGKFLGGAGYSVRAVSSPLAALEALRGEEVFDALVTDLAMPGMSGLALAEAARALRPDLRVVYTSGYADDVLAEHGIEAPPEILHKPFSQEDLLGRLRSLLAAP